MGGCVQKAYRRRIPPTPVFDEAVTRRMRTIARLKVAKVPPLHIEVSGLYRRRKQKSGGLSISTEALSDY